MTLNFSKHQFLSLLSESHAFREMVYGLLSGIDSGDAVEYYKKEIRARFLNAQGSDKIAAIKWLRANVSHDELEAFERAGYDCYAPIDGSSKIISLAGAKKFVESV